MEHHQNRITKFRSFPILLRIIIGASLTLIALAISSIFSFSNTLKYMFPIGLILLVFFNWLLFRWEGNTLDELGLYLNARNLKYLPLGLLLGVLAFALKFILTSWLKGDSIHFNPEFDIQQFLKEGFYLLPMAATQQFIVRSYCFVKTIEMTNVRVANIVFGILFISLHNIFGGNIFNTIFFAISLFISHLMFSSAFLSFKTLYFAIGIHWGCNVGNDHLLVVGQKVTSLWYVLPQPIMDNNGPGLLGIILYLLVSNSVYILLTVILWKWKSFKKSI